MYVTTLLIYMLNTYMYVCMYVCMYVYNLLYQVAFGHSTWFKRLRDRSCLSKKLQHTRTYY